MAERRLISSGSKFESQIGYSRAVVSGDWVFVSGCTGYDYSTGEIAAGDVAAQAEQTFRNIASALGEAGAGMRDVVRVRYILPNRTDFPKIWDVTKRWLGDVRPAATMVQAGLMEEAMLVEIEVTARIGGAAEPFPTLRLEVQSEPQAFDKTTSQRSSQPTTAAGCHGLASCPTCRRNCRGESTRREWWCKDLDSRTSLNPTADIGTHQSFNKMETPASATRHTPGNHEEFMKLAIEEARRSRPDPGKFCVGAVLVNEDTGDVLSRGYYLEYPEDYNGSNGSVHAERVCLIKAAELYGVSETELGAALPPNCAIYTTMEPCNARPTWKAEAGGVRGYQGFVSPPRVGN
ncbi:endoribonuclease L-PSP [Pyricularia oryzae Y34]|uniref:Endoribonuclease L-PSP n=1 Tax=Pyricularia oryzae (strain Y34) TaxID=1143189 RepID=A0AA97P128_PYRO3|nr:endoribonuclease L-PSP [Pyricularia oryzae Y34]